MHTGYQKLDDAICAHIGSGSKRHPIYVEKLLRQAASELGADVTESDERTWRLIDRRLQALKKAGRLRYERPNWVLVMPNVRANPAP